MTRSALRLLLTFGIALSSPLEAGAQSVAMSGAYGESNGRVVKLPLNPPRTACTQMQNARCHYGEQVVYSVPFRPPTEVDPLAGPSGGVGVSGAGVRIIDGGLAVGSNFTVPPDAFRQDAGHQFTPIVGRGLLLQLETTLSFTMPAASRALNPPSGTRVFQPDAWDAPGNGQTGRGAGTTTPISLGTQTTHNVTVRYKAGPNAFGGTMAALQDGEGRLYVKVATPLGSNGTNNATRPWVGALSLGDGIPDNAMTDFGAGWGYTRMNIRGGGLIKNLVGLAPPCTAATPPAPAGCGLVTNFSGFTLATVPTSETTKHLFAWTTGTVEVLLAETIGGFPADQLLTAMGYDTTSMTLSGGTVRNLGMVAGSFTRRVNQGAARNSQQIAGLDLRFTPEPGATVALLVGGAALAWVGGRRETPRRGRE
ncbi:MAG: hypothetical protein AB8G23_17980 [Myxococcota bacterium]